MCLRKIIYDARDNDVFESLASDVRQISDSNNMKRMAGKTKHRVLLVTAHGPTHLQPKTFALIRVAKFPASLYTRQCITA